MEPLRDGLDKGVNKTCGGMCLSVGAPAQPGLLGYITVSRIFCLLQTSALLVPSPLPPRSAQSSAGAAGLPFGDRGAGLLLPFARGFCLAPSAREILVLFLVKGFHAAKLCLMIQLSDKLLAGTQRSLEHVRFSYFILPPPYSSMAASADLKRMKGPMILSIRQQDFIIGCLENSNFR